MIRGFVAGIVLLAAAVALGWWLGGERGEVVHTEPVPRAPTPSEPVEPPVIDAPDPVPTTGVLRIVVRTDVSGLPLRGAAVSIYPDLADDVLEVSADLPREETIFTGRDGQAELVLPGPSRCGILITYPGRSGRNRRFAGILPGTVTLVEVECPEGGVLQGRVADPDGEPLPGAHLRVVDMSLLGGLRALREPDVQLLRKLLALASGPPGRGLVARSDEQGRYTIAAIPASVPLAALGSPETGNRVLISMHRDFAPLLVPVAIASDAPMRRDVQFRELAWRVEGTVLSASGEPQASVFVDALLTLTGGQSLTHALRTDESGGFQLPPVLGRASIAGISLVAYAPEHGFATATLHPRDREPEVLRLSSDGTVAVTVVDEAAAALEGARMRLRLFHAGEQVGEHFYTRLPSRVLVPAGNATLSMEGGLEPPAGYRCRQGDSDLLRIAYDLDEAVLFGGTTTFEFERGSLLDAATPK